MALRTTGRALSAVVRVACFAHLVLTYGFEIRQTRGQSMLPTIFYKDDYIVIDKRSRLGRNISVGDCVVVHKPTAPSTSVCKRVSGMPGDVVLRRPDESLDDFVKVPEGHCWITGDNLRSSADSREYGAVPLALVQGRVVASYMPPGPLKPVANTLVTADR
ncbi:peptidase S24/S26A/S26B/S26C [Dipodascopsis tothii]|uniref:peptidase S24/S26A/S26B/S26C n=1 Tax=Dipodascopsis tothii TaxID=44089 RepID=UPI0034CDF47A